MFQHIADPENLKTAWDKVKANAGGPGGDGVTLSDFAADEKENLSRLRDLLLDGDYWPLSLRIVEIPKKRGGLRVLRIPAIIDRVAQTATAMVLTPILDAEFEDSSFAYRPGRSVDQAARRVASLRRAGFTWTVEGDIDEYFDSIPHDILMTRFSASVSCVLTQDLISRWLEAYAPEGTGLPQGSPISPLLANLYLDHIDERIESAGVRLVRFADDFLLLCRSEMAASEARAEMIDLLAHHGLRLNPETVRIRSWDQSVRFLGHLFVRSIAVRELLDEEDGLLSPPTPAQIGTALGEMQEEAGVADATDDRASGAELTNRTRWIYLTEPGRSLQVRNRSFTINDGEDGPELAAVPMNWPEGIEVGAATMVDTDALRLAMARRIPVNFVAGDGRFLASLDHAPAERAALHLEQARHVLDPALRLDLARLFVAGRLRNQRAVLRKLNLRRKVPEVAEAAHRIGRLARKAMIQKSPSEAMGVEGEAAAIYWPALGRCFAHGMKFKKRERHPPPDPVNVVLSFLSTRLAGDMQALITRRGLHPGFAYLHASQDGRASLSLDLMEEFRGPIAERLCVYLFNNRMLKPGQFTETDTGRLRMAPDAIRRAIREYENWMQTPITDPQDGRRTTWRGLMETQILTYMRHIRGVVSYRPFVMDFTERDPEDPVDFR